MEQKTKTIRYIWSSLGKPSVRKEIQEVFDFFKVLQDDCCHVTNVNYSSGMVGVS